MHTNPWGLKSLAYPIQKKPLVCTGYWNTMRHPPSMSN
ncbi:hypothetical protein [Paraflavitalea speifideaquila]|nr:hypothetical protein [Paraflavitalea speifideiaquila]